MPSPGIPLDDFINIPMFPSEDVFVTDAYTCFSNAQMRRKLSKFNVCRRKFAPIFAPFASMSEIVSFSQQGNKIKPHFVDDD